MNIKQAETSTTKRGPAEYFTGRVWLDELEASSASARFRAVRVSFEPGARTAWHTHPHGQLLHILSGVGRVQREGGEVTLVHPGDTVWFEPGERHWHGAGPDRLFVHLAIQEPDTTGSSATWLEPVTQAVYLGQWST